MNWKPFWSEISLVGEEMIMHLPELLLVAGACGCLCGLEGMRVASKGEIEEDELDLSGVNELRFYNR